jgi:hypothetical protein
MEAYCMKCRVKKEMKNPKAITMKNGKPATQGTCPSATQRCFELVKPRAVANFDTERPDICQ